MHFPHLGTPLQLLHFLSTAETLKELPRDSIVELRFTLHIGYVGFRIREARLYARYQTALFKQSVSSACLVSAPLVIMSDRIAQVARTGGKLF